MDLKQRAKQLKKDIPAVFLALKHRDTPVIAKILAVFEQCRRKRVRKEEIA